MKKKFIVLFLVLVGLINTSHSQSSCGFTCDAEHEAEANAQLNAFILAAQNNLGLAQKSTCSNNTQGKVKLPVVFHLVYSNGTPSGSGSHWSNNKITGIVSQLNELFQHTSNETFSNPYSGADVEFEFSLAKRDPSGLATTGIVHHKTSKYSTVSMQTDTPMKTAYNWNTSKYINIYVVPKLSGASGYALFPSFHGGVRDGLVVDANSGGSGTLMTHEMGHYFGLYHTFQGGCENGNCLESGDKVCDTPPKSKGGMAGGTCASPPNTCSTDDDDTHDHNPFRPTSDGGIGDQKDALENYMDYTGACYGAFTQGQRERMRATLFGLRGSLINDKVLPVNITDVALEKVVYPGNSLCDQYSSVTIKIRNNGNASISNVPLTLEVNGVGKKNLTFAGPLAAGASKTVDFENILFNDGINSIIAYTNWDKDEVSENNMVCASTTVEAQVTESIISAGFEGDMSIWAVENQDQQVGFTPFDFTKCSDNSKKVLAFESRVQAGSSNSADYLVSKTIDLSDATDAKISYDYSYKNFYSNMPTVLSLEASGDCGASYSELDSKTSFKLNTTKFDRNYDAYYPKSCDDWKTEEIDLAAYVGKKVTLRFKVKIAGGQGQNLFLDNLNIEIERDNIPDCNGDIGGKAKVDLCGECAGGKTGIVPNSSCTDCNNELNGTAKLDQCGECAGGSTNIVPDATCTDCNGVVNGTAVIDNCGDCAGGNTGLIVNGGCVDCAGVPGGYAFIDSCGVCAGGTTSEVPNSSCLDCNGDPNGGANLDICGDCAGGRTGIIPDAACTDCNGDIGGTAYMDLCGNCAEGKTGIVANVSCTDCNGDINGTALLDNCNVCSGGNSGIVANSTCTDCNGDLNGTASIDACGKCSGGKSGNVPDNTCINTAGCSPIAVLPNVFCETNTSVELKATSATGSCNNLKWYDTEENGTIVETGCIFKTPKLSAATSYYVEDDVNVANTSTTKTTGYTHNSSSLQGQIPRWNGTLKTEFIANENTTLKEVDVHVKNCNSSNRFYVRLRDKTNSSGSAVYDKNISCGNNKVVTLNVNFKLIKGHKYEIYFNGASNKEFYGFSSIKGNYNDAFSSEVTILRSGENLNGGFGPFYNWKFPGVCPRTEVKVHQRCIEQCGNGIDDDGDGEIDEACKDFTCSGRLVQSLSDVLYTMNLSPFSLDTMVVMPFRVNALGYNPLDNKIYAVSQDQSTGTDNTFGQFVRISSDGTYEVLGFAVNTKGKNIATYAADIGYDGVYYVLDNGARKLYAVDLSTMLATTVVSPVSGFADIAYNPENKKLYGISSGKDVFEIDPVAGTSTNIGAIQGIPDIIEYGTGAVYFSPTGDLIAYGGYVNDNVQDDIIKLDINTLQASIINQDGIVAKGNDGASCPYTVKINKQANLGTVYPGDEFIYTIDVHNKTGFKLRNLNFTDVLPKELELQSVVKNELGPITNDTSKVKDLIEIKNFPLAKGTKTLEFKVKLKDEFICDPYELPNQAKVSNLPAALGEVIVSDDPNTIKEFDTTFVTVRANIPAVLSKGTLSSTGGLFCQSLQERLELKGSDGEIEWQHSTDGVVWNQFLGEVIDDSIIVIDEENTGTAIEDLYYRAMLTSICDTQYNEVHYQLAPPTPKPIVRSSFYCINDVASSLTAEGDEIKWYTTYPGTFVNAGPLPVTTDAGTSSYYVTQTQNGCESETVIQEVIITALPDAPDLGPYEFCKDEPGSSLGLNTSHLTWYESLTDLTPSHDEPLISYSTPMDTTFYVSVSINGCESPKAPLQVVIYDFPEAPMGIDTTYCKGESTVAVNADGNLLSWYSDGDLTTKLTSAPVPSSSIVDTLSYYVTQTTGFCEGPADTLNVIIYGVPVAPTVKDTAICQNEGLDSLVAIGDSLRWYDSELSTTVLVEQPKIDTSLVGIQTLYVTQTINGCESEKAEVKAEVFELPDAKFKSVKEICPDSSTVLEVEIVGGKANYGLSVVRAMRPDTLISSINSTSWAMTVKDSGEYIIKEVIDANNCKAAFTDTIKIGEISPLLIESEDYACYLATSEYEALFEVSGGVSPYSISGHNDLNTTQNTEGLFTSKKVGYVLKGEYQFKVTDASGCNTNTDVEIVAPHNCGCPIKANLIGTNTTLCEGDSIEYSVEVTGGTSLPYTVYYHIEDKDGNVSKDSLINLAADGIYTLGFYKHTGTFRLDSIADMACSIDHSATLDLVVNEIPNATITNVEDTIEYCQGSTISITGQAVTSASYQWYRDGIAILESSKDVTTSLPGLYHYKVSLNGCENYSDSLLAVELPNVTPTIIIEADKDVICPGEVINYSIQDTSFTGGDAIFIWKLNNVEQTRAESYTINTLQKGDSIVVEMRTSNQCQTRSVSTSNVINPTVNDMLAGLSFVSGELNPCEHEHNLTYEVSDLTANYNWQVTSGDGSLVSTNNNEAVVNIASENTSLTIMATNDCDSKELVIDITPIKRPELELFEDMSICAGDRDTLFVVDHANTIDQLNWYLNGESIGNSGTEKEIYQISQVGEYYVIGANDKCSDQSNPIYLSFISPAIELTATPDQIKQGEHTYLNVNTNVERVTWQSDNENLDLNDVTSLEYDADLYQTTIFKVEGTWGQCQISDTTTVFVVQPFAVPYFFSPNGDGENDFWEIENLGDYDSYSIKVFNRWGNIVRTYENSFNPWDGKNESDVDVSDGTYFYVIKTNTSGEEQSLSGYVTVVR